MQHSLKIYPELFKQVVSGDKLFEVRNNEDRGFQKGDELTLREYDPLLYCDSAAEYGIYSGFKVQAKVTYVSNYQQRKNYVVLGFCVTGISTPDAGEARRFMGCRCTQKNQTITRHADVCD